MTKFRRLCSSVQFSSRWYLCARKIPYALHSVSQKFPQRCLWNGSNVRLTDDGFLSSFQRRSSSASSLSVSLFQAIDGVMSLTLCPQAVSQAPQHFRSSETQATCDGCYAEYSQVFDSHSLDLPVITTHKMFIELPPSSFICSTFTVVILESIKSVVTSQCVKDFRFSSKIS